MTILGIDPGSRRIGYGVIESRGGETILRDAGLLDVKTKDACAALAEARRHIAQLIKKFKPEALAIEKLFFAKNQKTALQVAETRGVVLLAAFEGSLAVYEYTPNEIKLGIAGYGFADKKAVAKMVRMILKKPDLDLIDDAMDAIAIALFAAQDRRTSFSHSAR